MDRRGQSSRSGRRDRRGGWRDRRNRRGCCLSPASASTSRPPRDAPAGAASCCAATEAHSDHRIHRAEGDVGSPVVRHLMHDLMHDLMTVAAHSWERRSRPRHRRRRWAHRWCGSWSAAERRQRTTERRSVRCCDCDYDCHCHCHCGCRRRDMKRTAQLCCRRRTAAAVLGCRMQRWCCTRRDTAIQRCHHCSSAAVHRRTPARRPRKPAAGHDGRC